MILTDATVAANDFSKNAKNASTVKLHHLHKRQLSATTAVTQLGLVQSILRFIMSKFKAW
jgi:hypothetical protein